MRFPKRFPNRLNETSSSSLSPSSSQRQTSRKERTRRAHLSRFLIHCIAFSALICFVAVIGFSLADAADKIKNVGAPAAVPTSGQAASGTAASSTAPLKTATFAAGCYWGTEEFFRKIPGVVSTRVGFTGGTVDHPRYEDTHDGHTGHAESVEIKYDPKKVSYEHLLDQFFKMHDPTTLNRQGNDVGNQYRSAIFYTDAEQKKEAEAFKAKVDRSHAWKAPVTTQIAPAQTFWPAEEDHQKYLVKNPGGYDNHYLRKINFDTPK